MKKRLNPISKLLLCLMAAVFVLCSCNRGGMTDEQAKLELERLLPLSYEMNEIFWGKGLDYTDDGSNNRYMAVKSDCGYNSTEEILKKASEIFSEEYLAIIKDAIFTDSDDIDPRYIDVGGTLRADKYNEGFNIQGNIKLDSVKVKRAYSDTVIIKAEYADGGTTELTIVLQDGAWYLNGPTY